ncbi:MAG TPA: PIG-L family deacetylase [Burkholderiales bacterium]|nr:PIG-L family deacetylase [Burkholderiales bacterium]
MSVELLVLSPHLEDAVLGCGELIARHRGAVVVTPFAGIPEDTGVVPPWDAACGFGSRREAMVVRRREERRALERLDAERCWLGFLDRQYRRTDEVPGVALKVARALRRHRARRVALPLGLLNLDHLLTHRAGLGVLRREPQGEWLVYEEPQFGCAPEAVEAALSRLAAAGLGVAPLAPESGFAYEKKAALECYASHRRGRGGAVPAPAPERYWRITP